jgi:4-hydroxy-tetrahydrodipicolinate synthase
MFKGSMVALVTPMQPDGSIDKKSLRELIDWHIDARTAALIIAGTTGESATLNSAERSELIALAVKHAAGRIPVIAGTGTNCTASSIENTKAAELAGADGCLLVTPYYNRPTQKGLVAHFKAIAANTGLPIILYNVPGRTACDMLPETVEQLAHVAQVIGIKEATGDLDRAAEIQRRCGSEFMLYSGDDPTSSDFILQGGHGAISVTANVAPRRMQELCLAALAGNKALADEINAELMPLHKKLFLEANPIPTKWALHEMGLIPSGIRLPLLPLDERYHQDLRAALQQSGTMPVQV